MQFKRQVFAVASRDIDDKSWSIIHLSFFGIDDGLSVDEYHEKMESMRDHWAEKSTCDEYIVTIRIDTDGSIDFASKSAIGWKEC